MCKVMEDMRNQAAEEAEKRTLRDLALRMLKMGEFSYQKIAELSKMPVAEVEALAAALKS